MREDVRKALAIDASSTIADRTIDITTTDRRSGEPQDNTSLTVPLRWSSRGRSARNSPDCRTYA